MGTAYYERILQEDINTGITTATKRNPGGGTLVGTQVGIHTFAVGQSSYYDNTVTPGAIAAGSDYSYSLTVSGATLGDFVLGSLDIDLQGLTLTAYVSAADTVTVIIVNNSGASVTLAQCSLSVIVFKAITTAGTGGQENP